MKNKSSLSQTIPDDQSIEDLEEDPVMYKED